jgi:hypothetical protein
MYATSQINIGLSQFLGLQIPLKRFNFRGFIGLTPSLLFNTGDSQGFVQPWDEINLSIHESYEPFVLFGSWGVGVDYWRLSFEITREYSLTPIISNIDYEGETYDFNYSTKRWFLVLGFNFYPWKIKDQSQKRRFAN